MNTNYGNNVEYVKSMLNLAPTFCYRYSHHSVAFIFSIFYAGVIHS